MHIKRTNNRAADELRPIRVSYDIFEYAAGSILYEIGKTKVLCAVTLQQGVPPFLRGKKSGWLTAEYALLPASTPVRNVRESSSGKRNGRTIEISRMISRVLRSVIKLELLGERTIFVDCDVQQADGGTRTACITAACLALKAAQQRWLEEGLIADEIIIEDLAAISVGVVDGQPLLDVDFLEDSAVLADFNFVLTRSGKVAEVQGSSEQRPISWEQFELARELAVKGINTIFTHVFGEKQIAKKSEARTGFPLFMRLNSSHELQ